MKNKPKLTFKKILKHWHTIRLHRKWVRHYCFMAGIPWRGLVHDLSKYNPIEFFESARYWTGVSSPINEAKKDQGYSRAWLHHRGRNPHHWAYWADNFSEGFTVYAMPQNDFVEMICDFLAAGRTYFNLDFSYKKEYKWWLQDKEKGNKAMNPIDKKMVGIVLNELQQVENSIFYNYLSNSSIITPESLIKSKYIQKIWRENHVD